MKSKAYFGKKLEHLCKNFGSFWIQLAYFLFVSLIGFLALKISKPRTSPSFIPKNIDLFFTSVSATTVSSMSTVEMEVFSNSQLIIMTILMLLGGEVFTSMLELQFQKSELHKSIASTSSMSLVSISKSDSKPAVSNQDFDLENNTDYSSLKYSSVKLLGYVVLGYLSATHIGGSSLVAIYISLIPHARKILNNKQIHIQTFSTFTVVSTFANCGYIPTNENMIIFKKHSTLLLILASLTLLGNTFYAPSLRFSIWILEKITKRVEYKYILKNSKDFGYGHLMNSDRCWYIFMTVLGFISIQFVVFCSLEWNNSQVFGGLNWFEKFIAAIFQVVSTRHSGESIVDLSILSPAILATFVVMMYLPPYTSFLPIKKQEEEEEMSGKESKNGSKTIVQSLLFSQLSYPVIFIILICIVEREKLKKDPLNFNVLNITLEVISAYGNVGYSTGYSCARQLKPDSSCKDAMYGLVGKWSNFGKLILIIVMFFGRLKKFNLNGGKAWKLS